MSINEPKWVTRPAISSILNDNCPELLPIPPHWLKHRNQKVSTSPTYDQVTPSIQHFRVSVSPSHCTSNHRTDPESNIEYETHVLPQEHALRLGRCNARTKQPRNMTYLVQVDILSHSHPGKHTRVTRRLRLWRSSSGPVPKPQNSALRSNRRSWN